MAKPKMVWTPIDGVETLVEYVDHTQRLLKYRLPGTRKVKKNPHGFRQATTPEVKAHFGQLATA